MAKEKVNLLGIKCPKPWNRVSLKNKSSPAPGFGGRQPPILDGFYVDVLEDGLEVGGALAAESARGDGAEDGFGVSV